MACYNYCWWLRQLFVIPASSLSWHILALTWRCLCDSKLFSPYFSVRPFKLIDFYSISPLSSVLIAALHPNLLITLKVLHLLLTAQSPSFAQVAGRFHACATSNMICECTLSMSFVTMSKWILYSDLKTTDVFIVGGEKEQLPHRMEVWNLHSFYMLVQNTKKTFCFKSIGLRKLD